MIIGYQFIEYFWISIFIFLLFSYLPIIISSLIFKWICIINNSQIFNFINMKHMHQNAKFLDQFIQKVHQQLKMRMKFCTQKVTEPYLVLMLLQYIDHQSKNINQIDKQNICTVNNTLQNQQLLKKDEQIQYLKQQIKIEAQLTKGFFNQIRRQSINDTSVFRSSFDLPHTINQISPNPMFSSIRQSQATTPFIEPFSQANQKVNTSPLIESIQFQTNSISSGRSPKVSIQSNSNNIENQRQKSKTFARLRKVQAMFCQSKKIPNGSSRRKSLIKQSWNFSNKDSTKIMVEQNENLKAIQNNLVTHLQIMEKYKNIQSIQELVQKQQKLRKKELQLRQLQQCIEKRQRNVNKCHIEVLKKQKSIKML